MKSHAARALQTAWVLLLVSVLPLLFGLLSTASSGAMGPGFLFVGLAALLQLFAIVRIIHGVALYFDARLVPDQVEITPPARNTKSR